MSIPSMGSSTLLLLLMYLVIQAQEEVAFVLFLFYVIALIICVGTRPTKIHLILRLSVCISVRIQFFSEPVLYVLFVHLNGSTPG